MYISIASRLTEKSISFCAASGASVPATMALASMSQPTPSSGTMISIGAPAAFPLAPRKANEIPIGTSPAPAIFQGFEPEWVWRAMFLSRASR